MSKDIENKEIIENTVMNGYKYFTDIITAVISTLLSEPKSPNELSNKIERDITNDDSMLNYEISRMNKIKKYNPNQYPSQNNCENKSDIYDMV